MISNENILAKNLLYRCIMFKLNNFSKVRVGNIGDGGYVIPNELIRQFQNCVSFGVGNDISFEQGLYDRNHSMNFFVYDGTVDQMPKHTISSVQFNKTMISEQNINSAFDNVIGKTLFKCDIEGSEYGSVESISKNNLNKIDCIVIEVHWIFNDGFFLKFLSLMDFLNDKFSLFHIHSNNYSPQFKLGDYIIPSVLELTFVNNSIITQKSVSTDIIPIYGIDSKNSSFLGDSNVECFNDINRLLLPCHTN